MNRLKPIHILRFGLGIDMLMHGLVRLFNLPGFVEHSSSSFKTSFLPMQMVTSFLYVLPFIEGIIGLLILLGGKAGRIGLIGGGFLMSVLLFGTTSHQDWTGAAQQVVYLTAFAIALYFHDKETSLFR